MAPKLNGPEAVQLEEQEEQVNLLRTVCEASNYLT
jgi:hypothetical protein